MLAKVRLRLLHPYPALLIEYSGRRYLTVADLHIGFEERFKASGVRLKASAQSMVDALSEICLSQDVDEIVLLGDVKFNIGCVSALERREVPLFLEQASRLAKTTIIAGNHDGSISSLLPRGVMLYPELYMLVGDTVLMHGHTLLPSGLKGVSKVVMGHIHPTYMRKGSVLSGRHVWLLLKVKRCVFWRGRRGLLDLYVLPPFNRELSLSLFSLRGGRIISPIIRRAVKGVYDALLLTGEGDIIGGVDDLGHVI